MDDFMTEKFFAEDAKGGLEKYRDIQPDVVFLDIGLPDGSGIDLIKPMLEINPMVGIIMVTGSRLSSDVNNAKKRGAIGYILKPYTRKKIDNALRFYMDYHKLLEEDESEGAVAAQHVKERLNFFVGEEVKKPPSSMEEKPLSVENIIADWNVLFVDSLKANTTSAEQHLKKFCKHVDIATSANEFNQFVAEKEYQCILMDPLFSKENNGYELATAVKNQKRSSAIKPYLIALLPNNTELETQQWQDAGMDDFILKPCSLGEINKKLSKFSQFYVKDKNSA